MTTATKPNARTTNKRTTTTKRTSADVESNEISVRPGSPIDAERAAYEKTLVEEHLPLVQYVVSEVAHRIPSHVSRSDLVRLFALTRWSCESCGYYTRGFERLKTCPKCGNETIVLEREPPGM